MAAANVIGIGSGVLALSEFTIKAILSAYQEVTSFEGNQKTIRDIRRELEEFTVVLYSLDRIVKDDPAGLPDLDIPLSSCAKECESFKELIITCTSNPSNGRSVVRDWAKLKTKEDEIAAFKDKLARYKSTITLALCGANLRGVSATAKVLDEVEELVKETRLELEEQFSKLDTRLQALATPRASTSADDAAELKWIQEEKDSTKKWLTALAQISEHIDRARSNASADLSTTQKSRYTQVATLGDLISATRRSYTGLQKCSGGLAKVTDELEDHLQQIDNRMQSLSLPKVQLSDGNEIALQRAQEEQDSIQSCLSICAEVAERAEQVRTNVFDGVSAAQDSFQMVVSTIGDLISARNVTVGIAATQCLGQTSDATVQQISRDRAVAPHSARGSAADGNARGVNTAEDAGEGEEKAGVKKAENEEAGGREARGKKVGGKEAGAQSETLYVVQYGKGRNL